VSSTTASSPFAGDEEEGEEQKAARGDHGVTPAGLMLILTFNIGVSAQDNSGVGVDVITLLKVIVNIG
jgi:hypothetical protein